MKQLSMTDAFMLAVENERQRLQMASVSILAPPAPGESPVTRQGLRDLVSERIHLAPALRHKLRHVPLGLDYPYWIDDADLDLDHHVREFTLPEPGNNRQLADAAVIARYVFTSTSSRVIILAYSLLIHVISVSAAWCLAQAIAAPLEWTQALLLVLPVLLISTIPLSIAGWGTRESAMVLAFGYAGLLESNGLVVSMLFGIAAFAAGLVGGLVWILDRGRQFRDNRQVAR